MVYGPDLDAAREGLGESWEDGGAGESCVRVSFGIAGEWKCERPVAAWRISTMARVWVHLV